MDGYHVSPGWEGISELYGIDWLDLVYRVWHAFGVAPVPADFGHWAPAAVAELRAGQLSELITRRLWATGAAAPAEVWPGVVGALSGALGVPPDRVVPSARLRADLGMEVGAPPAAPG